MRTIDLNMAVLVMQGIGAATAYMGAIALLMYPVLQAGGFLG